MDFKVTCRNIQDIREIAGIVWKAIDYSPKSHKALPVSQILEWVMPFIDEDFTLEILPDDKMDGGQLHGNTIPKEHTIQLMNSVYEGMVSEKGRDRMTTMHEIGHYLLHFSEELSLARAVENYSLKPWNSAEWQAMRFAGEFLMPHEEIINMSIDEIVSTYLVSEKAAKYQKEH